MFGQKIDDTANCLIGAGAGYATYKYVPKYLVKKPLRALYDKKFGNIPKEENDAFYSSAKKVYENQNIKNKGIYLLHIDKTNYKSEIEKLLKEEHEIQDKKKLERKQKLIEKWKQNGKEYKEPDFSKKLDEWLKKFTDKMDAKKRKAFKEIAIGKNACYDPLTGKILFNKDKMSFALFHEMGHGITHKAGGLKKFNVAFSNILPFAIPLFLTVGLLKNKKAEGEKPNGTIDKTTTFIKENCGILASLCLIPKLIDEGMASHNGAKLAKNVLQPDKYKKLISMQRFAFSTYALGALLVFCFTNLAIKIRDKVVAQKLIS